MLTKSMKWISIAALLGAAMFWSSVASYQFLVAFVVCLGAGLVVMQAVRAKQYAWASGFVLIALLFNPIVAVFPFSGPLSLLLVLASIATFAVSLAALRAQPLLSIPSITDRNPGSHSL